MQKLANKKQEAMEVDEVSQPSKEEEPKQEQEGKEEIKQEANVEMKVEEQEKVTVIEPPKPTLPRAAETGVKIGVGISEVEEPIKEEKPTSGSNIGAFDEERYNEYMLSTAGPR